MIVTKSIADTRKAVAAARAAGKRIGFVPTMGYLHRGHTSLVSIAREQSEYQVMSIFVNKMQFNDPKDYDTYPVDLERDFAMAEEAGVDCVFNPPHEEMYPGNLTYIDIEKIADTLCGAARPGHFRGVLTVVAKLFNIVLPDVAVFGQKDIQQAAILTRMVEDLNFPLRLIVAPTVREEDGLAMSSRNKHLTADDRKNALAIHRSLQAAERLIAGGERKSAAIINEMERVIGEGKPGKVDYVSIVRFSDFAPVDRIDEKSVIAVAAFFGKPRLIDNMVVEVDKGGFSCRY